ncbi:MAG TPA: hypothetical protein PKD68_01645 [Candidatus Saccharibacteria bacterium]|nr:hypothetical protein [Candidatus Saccharibacteria bacterium]
MPEKKFFTLKGDYAVASLVIGILSIALFFPLLLLPGLDGLFALLAIILGCFSLKGARRSLAITGIFLGSLALAYGLVLVVQALIYL